jgi:hypothetical protein
MRRNLYEDQEEVATEHPQDSAVPKAAKNVSRKNTHLCQILCEIKKKEGC